MDLYLIRHAQSANNALDETQRVADPGLTELGRGQADRLAVAVAELQLTHLYTSPFRRTLETTRAIHCRTGLIPTVRSELHEQGGCYSGHAAVGRVGQPGMNRREITTEFTDFVLEDDIDETGWWKGRGFETYEEAVERARRVVRWVQVSFAETSQRVALVMHADFKSLLLRELQPGYVATPYNASVTRVRYEARKFRLVDFNDVSHLPDNMLTF